jgi:hypothetical protein
MLVRVGASGRLSSALPAVRSQICSGQTNPCRDCLLQKGSHVRKLPRAGPLFISFQDEAFPSIGQQMRSQAQEGQTSSSDASLLIAFTGLPAHAGAIHFLSSEEICGGTRTTGLARSRHCRVNGRSNASLQIDGLANLVRSTRLSPVSPHRRYEIEASLFYNMEISSMTMTSVIQPSDTPSESEIVAQELAFAPDFRLSSQDR